MFINSIKLKNYRCYENSIIEFQSTDNKNVVAITGKMGAGKTSLFNAIGWCIFGYETQKLIESKEKTDENEMGVPNELSFDSNQKAQVSVEMDITLDREYKNVSRLKIRRSAIYYKNNVNLPINTVVDILAYDSINQPVEVNEKIILEELMPKEISSFYIFDGEYLQKTAEKGGANVKQGIDKLFKLEKFQKLSSYFTDILKHYESERRRQSKLQGKAKNIELQISTNRDEVYSLTQDISDLDRDITQLKIDIQQVSGSIESIFHKAQDFGKYNQLSKILSNLKAQRDRTKLELNKTILQNAYILNSNGILTETQKELDKNKLVINKKLPPDIRVEFLNNLLKDRQCICSRPLEVGSSEYNTVIRLLEEFKEVSNEEYLIDLKYRIDQALNSNSLSSQIKSLRDSISNLTDDIKTTDSEINSLDIAKEEISSADSTISQFEKLRSKNEAYTTELNRKIVERDDKKKKVEDLNAENKQLEEESGSYIIDEGETSILNEREKTTELLRYFFEKFSERAIEKFANVLEDNINNILSNNRVLSKFQVKIPYHDGLISFKFAQDGQERYYFSGGQSQLVGIVLMAGFVNVMQNAMKSIVSIPFVVMDHPTSHADKDAKELIHSEIGKLFDGTQVVYLTTDSEFPDLIDKSKLRLGSTYSIVNNGSSGSDFKREVI